MNATVNVLCYRSKTLSNGENPIMLRICKDGKKKYQSLKFSVNPRYWDFEKERPKRNCPNREYIEQIISTSLEKVRKQILELNVEEKDYSAQSLLISKSKRVSITVGKFYNIILDELKQTDKYGNWRIYNSSYRSIKRFTNNKMDFLFSEIDIVWLNNYEQWLRNNGNKETTISVQFRTLRAIYNRAIETNATNKNHYPFNTYKINKLNLETQKRAISKKDINQIIDLDLSSESYLVQFSRDIFIFSYLCGGINFVDIAYLKPENICNSQLIYKRQKTKKTMNVFLLDKAEMILKKYAKNQSNNYIFPIIDTNIHTTEEKRSTRIHNLLYRINQKLQIIAKLAGVNTHLTTYVARHSFATVLKRSGVSTSIISESLGHSSEKTTQIYLDSFENKQLESAMENLL